MPDTTDADILQRIHELVDEEHHLEREHAGSPLPEQGKARLAELEVQLDQLWDLLRQRRARRHADEPSVEAALRDRSTVERYQQ
jgi:hypothetical protein